MSALHPKADIVGDAGQTRHQSKSHSFLIRPLCVHEAFFKAQSEDEPQLSKKAEFHKAGVVPRSKAEAGLSACPRANCQTVVDLSEAAKNWWLADKEGANRFFNLNCLATIV